MSKRSLSIAGFPGLFTLTVIVLLAWFSAAHAAVDTFLKIEGIPGESTDAAHAGWIEILSYGFSLERSATYGAAGTERSSLSDFSVLKMVDKASPLIFKHCCGGEQVSTATLEIRRSYGLSATPVPYMEITLSDVIISSVSFAGTVTPSLTAGGSDRPVEEVTFSYGKIKWDYVQRDPDTGAPLEEITEGWNAAEDEPVSPIDLTDAWQVR